MCRGGKEVENLYLLCDFTVKPKNYSENKVYFKTTKKVAFSNWHIKR